MIQIIKINIFFINFLITIHSWNNIQVYIAQINVRNLAGSIEIQSEFFDYGRFLRIIINANFHISFACIVKKRLALAIKGTS